MKIFRKFKAEPKSISIPNISYHHNFLFVHIPKNAGSAIYQSVGLQDSNHRTVKEYVDILGIEKYESMFSFAFVRNPFSRFISLYNYARMEISYYHNNISPEKAIFGHHLDFNTLKSASIEEAAHLLHAGKLVHNPPHIQWNPQGFWLKDDKGKLNVKYLGRFEDIHFHMRNIRTLIGQEKVLPLNKVNSSTKEVLHYKKLINKDTRTILEDYYKEDLDSFNYDF